MRSHSRSYGQYRRGSTIERNIMSLIDHIVITKKVEGGKSPKTIYTGTLVVKAEYCVSKEAERSTIYRFDEPDRIKKIICGTILNVIYQDILDNLRTLYSLTMRNSDPGVCKETKNYFDKIFSILHGGQHLQKRTRNDVNSN